MFFKLSRRVTQEPKRLRSLQVKQFMSLHTLLFHAPRPDTRQTSESFRILARGSTQTLPRTTNLQVFYDWDPCDKNSKAIYIRLFVCLFHSGYSRYPYEPSLSLPLFCSLSSCYTSCLAVAPILIISYLSTPIILCLSP
jgi:hypothetical protein